MATDITVCIPTLNRYDLLRKELDSLLTGTIIPKKVVVINNGVEKFDYKYEDLDVLSFGENLGVAKSWNWFLNNVSFPMLIANDDLEFGKDDLALFSQYYDQNKADFYYPENINHLNVFSCFMPTKECIEKVGLFDTQFKRGYFEDNDFFRRMMLLGIKIMAVPTNLTHFVSGTFKGLEKKDQEEHHRLFRENRAYYIKKWGGEPHQEIYRSPFNK